MVRSMVEGTQAVALTLELAQTIAVGPFNAHIITPEWLVRWKVLPDQAVEVRVGPLIDGATFRFGRLEWQVDGRHLLVSSSTVAYDCGEMVDKVLGLLPHTPVQAVGHNFQFLGRSREEWRDSPVPRLGTKGLGDLAHLEQSRWTGVFQREGARVELTVAYAAEGVVVLFNHHRNTNTMVEEAQAAARQFRHDLLVSRSMLRELLDQEVVDDEPPGP